MEKYSFLMSVYHKEKKKYLELSIESMLNQSVKPDEIVIVKDGPLTRELDEIIDKYSYKYKNVFNIVSLKKNVGLGLALNEGLKAAKNDLVARMDSDDICKVDRCKIQLSKFANDKKLVICGSNIDEFNGDINNITGHRVVPEKMKDIYDFSKRRSAFNHPTVMYKKSKVLENNGYSNLKRNQDVDLFGRMIFAGCKAYNIQDSLLWFRSDDDLAKRRRSWENTKSYIGTIRKFWKMGFSSFTDYFTVLVGQTVMFLMPVKVQHFIYKKFLRS